MANLYHLLKFKLRQLPLWHLGVLVGLWLLVVFTNIPQQGKMFLGWDNLIPEFNLILNLKRAIFGVWQGHQGLGHIGGHGYAATLVHTLMIGLTSLVVPFHLLRAVFILLMWLVGGVGCFFFIQTLLKQHATQKNHGALLGSLFYMLNLGTIQNFYVPLEAFIFQFAFLPWLILTLTNFLHKSSRKNLFLFAFSNLLATPMGFIPPLFVVYCLFVGLIVLGFVLQVRKKSAIKVSCVSIFTIIAIHSFWLFPVIHYSLTRSQEYLNSYSNLTTTPDFILQNKKYGDLANIALLKGFYFESLDSVTLGKSFKILEPWINHLSKPGVTLIWFFIFIIICIGFARSIFDKNGNRFTRIYALLFFISFTALATNIWPFSFLSEFLQNYVPIFKQAFRIAFTKFSISVSFWYAVFFAYGLISLFRIFSNLWLKRAIYLTILIALLVFSLPVFKGDFFYRKARLTLPQAYVDLFHFMNQQPQTGRIANFSQGWRTGWSIYHWGYSGSGFLWFGLPQPLLDRAYDVWSQYNENYFWEISDAIYTQDYASFEKIIDKYDIKWILFDKNARPYETVKEPLYIETLETYLNQSNKVKLERVFSSESDPSVLPILLYQVVEAHTPIRLMTGPNIQPQYYFNDRDEGYIDQGNYLTDSHLPFDVYYPFRSLFSGRTPLENEFLVSETDTSILFTKNFATQTNTKLNISGLDEVESFAFGAFESSIEENNLHLTVKVFHPEIKLDGVQVVENEFNQDQDLTSFTYKLNTPLSIVINGQQTTYMPNISPSPIFLLNKGKNYIDINDGTYVYHTQVDIAQFSDSLLTTEVSSGEHTLQVLIPKLTVGFVYTSKNNSDFADINLNRCNNEIVRSPQTQLWNETGKYWNLISDKDSTECIGIYLPEFPHRYGYMIETKNRYHEGKPFQFTILNQESKRPDISVFLPKTAEWTNSYFIQSPQKADDLGYSIKLSVNSIGNMKSKNDLGEVNVWPIPYNFLKQISFTKNDLLTIKDVDSEVYTFSHPNPALYIVHLDSEIVESTLTLSESYNQDWLAFVRTNQFPYFKRLTYHVLVNNWENGWKIERLGSSELASRNNNQELNPSRYTLDANTTIYIFFWPQILEFVGFALLPLPFLFIFSKK